MARISKRLALAALWASCAQLACGTRRWVYSMSVGERALAKFKQEEDQMLREAESFHRSASNMTIDAARNTLKNSGAATAELLSLVDEHLQDGKAPQLRQGLIQKYKPSSGIKKARNMLNNMINENNRKLDTLKTECSNFFNKQCSLMATCRSEVSSSNAEAADWRGKILFAQKEINVAEMRLPVLKNDLAVSIAQCNTRLMHLRRDLAIVLDDIKVMTKVLKLTECKSKLIQMEEVHIVECEHPCTKESFLAFHHEDLNEQLAQIKSANMRQLVQQGLRELASPAEKSQVPVDENGTVVINKTVFKNPPLPQTPLPKDPCKGISYDAGGKGGCTLRSNPQCFNLQNKFINIQGETVDKKDELLEEIKHLETSCERTQKEISEGIDSFQAKHDDNTALLAQATAGENKAAKAASEKGQEHKDLEKSMFQNRKACSANMRTFESELCALKKIRGELMKLKGDKHPFFQDCEVSKWKPDTCSKSCGGGIQTLKRGIIAPPNGGGAICPPLSMKRGCNQHPCPIDCKVGLWSRFSACSADCGGGVRQRMRKVKVHPRFGGEPCGDQTETEACNMQACDRNCKLGHWTKYSVCSRACDGGSKYSKRTIKVAAVGKGSCPKPKSSRRLRKKPCNTQRCPSSLKVLKCKNKIDLVMLLDGSGSIKKSGWKATKEFATKMVDAFDKEPSQVSIILFSGPRTWKNYKICNGPKSSSVDQEKICGLKLVQHFSNDTAKTKKNIAGLAFPKSSTYTAKALEMANAELTLGRKGAKRVVLVMTDGIPISPKNTGNAARKLRKRARVVFGAVRMTSAGMAWMQKWASRPARDNVLRIRNFKQMAETETMNKIVRDICSKVKAA